MKRYCCEYFTDSLKGSGTLHITYLDTTRNIITGTFDFKLSALPKVFKCPGVEVESGRFDFTYREGIVPSSINPG